MSPKVVNATKHNNIVNASLIGFAFNGLAPILNAFASGSLEAIIVALLCSMLVGFTSVVFAK